MPSARYRVGSATKSGIFRVVFAWYSAGEEASDTAGENVTLTKHGFESRWGTRVGTLGRSGGVSPRLDFPPRDGICQTRTRAEEHAVV